MDQRDKENQMIDEYRYGKDNFAIIWPYDVDMEALMEVVEKIVKENQSSCLFSAASYGAFSTTDGWTFDMLNDQTNAVQGTGATMLQACYNGVIKYITNEKLKL